jgi:exosortase/archaeosortase family protein
MVESKVKNLKMAKVNKMKKGKPREKKKLEPGFKSFLWRTGIFLGAFMAYSFIIGKQIFLNNFMTLWRIDIYPRIGYILLFSIAGFILLYRKRLTAFQRFKYKPRDALMLLVSVMMLVAFCVVEIYSVIIPLTTLNLILVHIIGISIFLFLAVGIYGISFTKHFLIKFKKELFYFLIFGIIVYSLMNVVWNSWPFFSAGVLVAVKFLLKVIGVEVAILGPSTISVNGFAAQIAEACSGVYSIFIFSALYLFIVFLDWEKMNKKKAAIMFVPAVLGAFLFNIIRVFTLMLVGAYISRNLALGMYHSYAGMIFFLIYFGLFWGLGYKYMKK